jgi:hypothetical protein
MDVRRLDVLRSSDANNRGDIMQRATLRQGTTSRRWHVPDRPRDEELFSEFCACAYSVAKVVAERQHYRRLAVTHPDIRKAINGPGFFTTEWAWSEELRRQREARQRLLAEADTLNHTFWTKLTMAVDRHCAEIWEAAESD